jgi:hypothetical protein
LSSEAGCSKDLITATRPFDSAARGLLKAQAEEER